MKRFLSRTSLARSRQRAHDSDIVGVPFPFPFACYNSHCVSITPPSHSPSCSCHHRYKTGTRASTSSRPWPPATSADPHTHIVHHPSTGVRPHIPAGRAQLLALASAKRACSEALFGARSSARGRQTTRATDACWTHAQPVQLLPVGARVGRGVWYLEERDTVLVDVTVALTQPRGGANQHLSVVCA